MTRGTSDIRTDRLATWKYAWWVLTGVMLGIGVAGLMTVGLAFLALGVVLALIGALRPALRNRSALAMIGGLAVAPLYIAWLNRGGPGKVCRTEGTAVSCVQAWSPWPLLAVGVVLIVGCVALVRRR